MILSAMTLPGNVETAHRSAHAGPGRVLIARLAQSGAQHRALWGVNLADTCRGNAAYLFHGDLLAHKRLSVNLVALRETKQRTETKMKKLWTNKTARQELFQGVTLKMLVDGWSYGDALEATLDGAEKFEDGTIKREMLRWWESASTDAQTRFGNEAKREVKRHTRPGSSNYWRNLDRTNLATGR